MFKKLVLITIVLTALMATATLVFAATNFCDPPPVQGQARNLRITCYVNTDYSKKSPEILMEELTGWLLGINILLLL